MKIRKGNGENIQVSLHRGRKNLETQGILIATELD